MADALRFTEAEQYCVSIDCMIWVWKDFAFELDGFADTTLLTLHLKTLVWSPTLQVLLSRPLLWSQDLYQTPRYVALVRLQPLANWRLMITCTDNTRQGMVQPPMLRRQPIRGCQSVWQPIREQQASGGERQAADRHKCTRQGKLWKHAPLAPLGRIVSITRIICCAQDCMNAANLTGEHSLNSTNSVHLTLNLQLTSCTSAESSIRLCARRPFRLNDFLGFKTRTVGVNVCDRSGSFKLVYFYRSSHKFAGRARVYQSSGCLGHFYGKLWLEFGLVWWNESPQQVDKSIQTTPPCRNLGV